MALISGNKNLNLRLGVCQTYCTKEAFILENWLLVIG